MLASPAPSAAVVQHATLSQIEQQVMCVTCRVPLAVAESPQADRERAFIRAQIARGENEAQIKRALVAQYGSSVLALPRASGFGIAAYAVPAGGIALVALALALALTRWRRREGEQPAAEEDEPTGADEERLRRDLAQFDA